MVGGGEALGRVGEGLKGDSGFPWVDFIRGFP